MLETRRPERCVESPNFQCRVRTDAGVWYGMSSALHSRPAQAGSLEAFYSQPLRKVQRIKSTFDIKVLKDNPLAQSIRNKKVRTLADQPPHTQRPQGTTKVVWSRFKSNPAQPGKEMCVYEGVCLQGWFCKVSQ